MTKIGKIDLAQIECRILNTVAGQWDVVEKFRRGEDVYAALASSVFGYPVTKETAPMERQAGKVLELQAGYGSGEDKIRWTLRQNKVEVRDDISYRDGYRNEHRDVVNLWGIGNQMLWHLYNGMTVPWGCCTVHDHRIFHNASGLWLDFTSLSRVEEAAPMQANGVIAMREVWRHRVKDGSRRTYGARLIENLIQWLARMKIADAMVKISRLGLRIVLTAHDDVYILLPMGGAEPEWPQAIAIMKEGIPWLPRCPIDVEFTVSNNLE